MSTTIPDLQVFIDAGGAPVLVLATDLGLQVAAGKIRIDLIGGGILYSQGPKVATFTATLPALPDGLQVDAINQIVEEQDIGVTVMMAGGKHFKSVGVLMETDLKQSGNSGQEQTVTIELPVAKTR
jgi:hypothetical protein